jgi:hypothetical protein
VVETGYCEPTRQMATLAAASDVERWKQAAADWVYGGTDMCGWHTQQRVSEQDYDRGVWYQVTRIKYVEGSLETEVVNDIFGGVDPGGGRVVVEVTSASEDAKRDDLSVWIFAYARTEA